MPIYRVQGPDGTVYRVEGPENASDEQLIGAVRQSLQPTPTAAPQPQPQPYTDEGLAELQAIGAERRDFQKELDAVRAEEAEAMRDLERRIGPRTEGFFGNYSIYESEARRYAPRIARLEEELAALTGREQFLAREGRPAAQISGGRTAIETLKGIPTGAIRGVADVAGIAGVLGEGGEEFARSVEGLGESAISGLGLDQSAEVQEALQYDPSARFTVGFGEALGSVAPYIGTSIVGSGAKALATARNLDRTAKAVGIATAGTQAALATGQGAAEARDRMDAWEAETGQELDQSTRQLMQLGGGTIGLTELLPIDRLMGRAPSGARKVLQDKLMSLATKAGGDTATAQAVRAELRAITNAIESRAIGRMATRGFIPEAAQEGTTQFLQNILEGTYDPTQEAGEGVWENALIGGLVGGTVRGGGELIGTVADTKQSADADFAAISADREPVMQLDIQRIDPQDATQRIVETIDVLNLTDDNQAIIRLADGTVSKLPVARLDAMVAGDTQPSDAFTAASINDRLLNAAGEDASKLSGYVATISRNFRGKLASAIESGDTQDVQDYISTLESGFSKQQKSAGTDPKLRIVGEAKSILTDFMADMGRQRARPGATVTLETPTAEGTIADQLRKAQDDRNALDAERIKILEEIAADPQIIDKGAAFTERLTNLYQKRGLAPALDSILELESDLNSALENARNIRDIRTRAKNLANDVNWQGIAKTAGIDPQEVRAVVENALGPSPSKDWRLYSEGKGLTRANIRQQLNEERVANAKKAFEDIVTSARDLARESYQSELGKQGVQVAPSFDEAAFLRDAMRLERDYAEADIKGERAVARENLLKRLDIIGATLADPQIQGENKARKIDADLQRAGMNPLSDQEVAQYFGIGALKAVFGADARFETDADKKLAALRQQDALNAQREREGTAELKAQIKEAPHPALEQHYKNKAARQDALFNEKGKYRITNIQNLRISLKKMIDRGLVPEDTRTRINAAVKDLQGGEAKFDEGLGILIDTIDAVNAQELAAANELIAREQAAVAEQQAAFEAERAATISQEEAAAARERAIQEFEAETKARLAGVEETYAGPEARLRGVEPSVPPVSGAEVVEPTAEAPAGAERAGVGAPVGVSTTARDRGERGKPALEEPPVPEGMVRVYHSGSRGEGQSGRWVSTDRTYASNYRADLPLFYFDIPKSDSRIEPAYPEQGVERGFTFNFELTPEEAAQLVEIRRETPKAAPTPTTEEVRLTEAELANPRLNNPNRSYAGFVENYKGLKERIGRIFDNKVLSTIARKLNYRYQDAVDYTKWLANGYGVGTLPSEMSLERKFELFESRKTGNQMQVHNTYVRPIIDKMKELEVDPQDIGMYLWARGAKDRNKLVAERNAAFQEAGSGLSDAEAEGILQEFALRGLTPKLEAVAKKHDNLVDYLLNLRVKEGLLSPAERSMSRKLQPFYTPLKGFAAEGDMQQVGEPPAEEVESLASQRRRGTGINPREYMSSQGRKSMPFNPLFNLFADASHIIQRAEENRVGRVLLRNILDDPETHEGIAKVYTDAEPKVNYESSKDPAHPEGTPKNTAMQLGASRGEFMVVKDNGKVYYIDFASTDAGQALKRAFANMKPKQLNEFLKGYMWVAQGMKSVLTRYSPLYLLGPAPLRDIQDAITTAYAKQGQRGSPVEGKKFGKAVAKLTADPRVMAAVKRHVLGQEPTTSEDADLQLLLDEMIAEGGAVGHALIRSSEQLAERATAELKNYARRKGVDGSLQQGRAYATTGVKAVGEALDATAQMIDLHARLATYKAARDMGVNPEDAASLALDSSLNLTRRGEWAGFLDNTLFFFSPTVESARKMGKMYTTPNGAKALLTKFVTMSALLTLWNSWMGGDDDDGDGKPNYMEVPEYTRQTRMVIFYGSGADDYVAIPLGFMLTVPMYIGNKATEYALGQTTSPEAGVSIMDAITTTAGGAYNLLSPLRMESDVLSGFVPGPIAPFYDLTMNRNFFDSPIYQEQGVFDSRVRSELGKPQTAQVWKSIARGMNRLTGGSEYAPGWASFQPEGYKYLVEQLGGGAYRSARDVVNFVSGDDADKPLQQRIPIVRNFFGKGSEYAPMNKFFDTVESSLGTPGMAEIAKAYNADDPTEFNDMYDVEAAGDPVRFDQEVIEAYSEVKKEVDRLGRAAREERDTAETPEEMKEIKDYYDGLKSEEYMYFNRVYADVKREYK